MYITGFSQLTRLSQGRGMYITGFSQLTRLSQGRGMSADPAHSCGILSGLAN